MQLNTCIVSSDANPYYLAFYPLVHRAWREVVGIRCVLALVATEIPPSLSDFVDDIVLVPPSSRIESGLLAQCVRLVAPQLVETDDAVLVSDIDMIPMSRDFYLSPVSGLSNDTFAVYRSDILREYPQFPICFNAATPTTWRDLVGSKVTTPADAVAIVEQWPASGVYDGPGSPGWSLDQEVLFRLVEAFDPKRVRKFVDAETGFSRLDRSELVDGRPTFRQRLLASAGAYTDYHMARPMETYSATNQQIAALAMRRLQLPSLIVKAASSSALKRVEAGVRRRISAFNNRTPA